MPIKRHIREQYERTRYGQDDIIAEYAATVPAAVHAGVTHGAVPGFRGEHGKLSRTQAYRALADHLPKNTDNLHPHGVVDARDLLPY